MYFVKKPYLQLPKADGITVMWETDEIGASKVHIWEALCPACGDVEYKPQAEARIFAGGQEYMHWRGIWILL